MPRTHWSCISALLEETWTVIHIIWRKITRIPTTLVFLFNWRIIFLQYCIDFCHTTMWISHMYTYISSLLNLPPTSHPIPPLWVIAEHQVELPVLYSNFLLSVLQMVMCVFQCYTLNSSHPLFPLLCPQVCSLKWGESCSVVSNSLRPHGLYSPWNSPGQSTGGFPFSRGSSQPRDRTQVSRIAGWFFTSWATGETQEYWSG